MRRMMGHERIPQWDRSLPGGGRPRHPRVVPDAAAVYLPACVGTMFGPEPGYPGVQEAFIDLCEQAGVRVTIPDGIASSCCGTPFSSKGYRRAYRQMRDAMVPWLWDATDQGRLPVVVDAASCTEGWHGAIAGVEAAYGGAITVIDVVAFTRSALLPRLPQPARLHTVAVHPTCSTTRMGLTPDLLALASVIAERVEVPADWGCCGFAGDRGLLHPELTASATARQAVQVRALGADAHVSANRTCELGMTRATGTPYVHVIEQLAIALGRDHP